MDALPLGAIVSSNQNETAFTEGARYFLAEKKFINTQLSINAHFLTGFRHPPAIAGKWGV